VKNSDFAARWDQSLQANYGTPTIALTKGKGLVVQDSEGKKYLDFLGGIATNIVGHAHPAIIKAVSKQISELSHVSNFYMHAGVIELAEKLIELTGAPKVRVFFAGSGAEANEAALKLSRRTGRTKIVAAIGAFHGRTMGALSLTGQSDKRKPFLPLLKGVTHIPYGDLNAMRRAVSHKTAMVIIEPIMGEAGVVVPPQGYLKGIRDICDATGALMVLDCVQTGMGRTGQWFGFENEAIIPDVITLAKGLGGGLPLGAMIAIGPCSEYFKAGDHGSTFGGNPVSCAASLAAISVIEKGKLLKAALVHEKRIKKSIGVLAGVAQVRGAGLLIGIELINLDAKKIAKDLQEFGILVNAPTPTTIRIAPALTVSPAQIEKFISVFSSVLKRAITP